MNNVLDLFIGDPVYDGQKNVIRRDFGVKNIVAIMVVGFIGYSLMGETKPISGKRKMKGGGASPTTSNKNIQKNLITLGGLLFLCLILVLILSFTVSPNSEPGK